MSDNSELPPELLERQIQQQAEPDEPPIAVPDDEEGNGRRNAATTICNLARQRFIVFLDQNGDVFADTRDGTRRTMPVSSQQFHNELRRIYRATTGGLVGADDAFKNAIRQIIADAQGVNLMMEVHLRVHRVGGSIFIDMCDERWRAIEVTAEGWRIIDQVEGFRFIRYQGNKPLPEPRRGVGHRELIHGLRSTTNLQTGPQIVTALSWLLSLLTNGPYQILMPNGPDGAAKTTTTLNLTNIIDPHSSGLKVPPKNSEDLAIGCKRRFIQALDNVSSLSHDMSDMLCRVSTGGTLSKRKLYSDDEETQIFVRSPIIMNGIPNLAERRDLQSRSLALPLNSIADRSRRTEASVRTAFAELHPALLGGLLNIAVGGLANEDKFVDKPLSRMADSAAWTLACARGISLGALRAVKRVMNGAAALSAEASLSGNHFAKVLIMTLDGAAKNAVRGDDGGCSIEYQAKDLYDFMTATHIEIMRSEMLAGNKHFWPGNSRAMTSYIDRILTALETSGIEVLSRSKDGRKLWSFKFTDADKYGVSYKF